MVQINKRYIILGFPNIYCYCDTWILVKDHLSHEKNCRKSRTVWVKLFQYLKPQAHGKHKTRTCRYCRESLYFSYQHHFCRRHKNSCLLCVEAMRAHEAAYTYHEDRCSMNTRKCQYCCEPFQIHLHYPHMEMCE